MYDGLIPEYFIKRIEFHSEILTYLLKNCNEKVFRLSTTRSKNRGHRTGIGFDKSNPQRTEKWKVVGLLVYSFLHSVCIKMLRPEGNVPGILFGFFS
jgi:hypothetical protein